VGVDECMVCEAEEYGCLLNTKGGENIETVKFLPLTVRPTTRLWWGTVGNHASNVGLGPGLDLIEDEEDSNIPSLTLGR
jgi:hypothetical protein